MWILCRLFTIDVEFSVVFLISRISRSCPKSRKYILLEDMNKIIIIYDYDNSHAYNNYDIIVVIAHVLGPACLYISIFLLTWNWILLVFYHPKYHLQQLLPLTIDRHVYVGPTMLPQCWTKQPFYWRRPNLISLRWGYKLILFINNSFTKFNPREKV